MKEREKIILSPKQYDGIKYNLAKAKGKQKEVIKFLVYVELTKKAYLCIWMNIGALIWCKRRHRHRKRRK